MTASLSEMGYPSIHLLNHHYPLYNGHLEGTGTPKNSMHADVQWNDLEKGARSFGCCGFISCIRLPLWKLSALAVAKGQDRQKAECLSFCVAPGDKGKQLIHLGTSQVLYFAW